MALLRQKKKLLAGPSLREITEQQTSRPLSCLENTDAGNMDFLPSTDSKHSELGFRQKPYTHQITPMSLRVGSSLNIRPKGKLSTQIFNSWPIDSSMGFHRANGRTRNLPKSTTALDILLLAIVSTTTGVATIPLRHARMRDTPSGKA